VLLTGLNPRHAESFELFLRHESVGKFQHRRRWKWAARTLSSDLRLMIDDLRAASEARTGWKIVNRES
jgi:hypothetical protein